MNNKPKILLIADVPDWIFNRHCQNYKQHLSDEFDFDIIYQNQGYDENKYDLIYPLEFNLVAAKQIKNPNKYITGIRAHVLWEGHDMNKFVKYLNWGFKQINVVSMRLYKIFSPNVKSIKYVTHGVDINYFTPSYKNNNIRNPLCLGWAGNKVPPHKGFRQFVAPLPEHCNIELKLCGYGTKNLNAEEMREFYSNIDMYIMPAAHEGNSNVTLESAAMELPIITTDSGTVPEYLVHMESALIIDRSLPSITRAVNQLITNPELRKLLGTNARKAIIANRFTFEERMNDYRIFFRENV